MSSPFPVLRSPFSVLLPLALAAAATPLAAQTIREASATRQHRGETNLQASVQYAGGTLRVEPAPTGVLYSLRLTYDEDRFAPLVRFDPARPAVTLGVEPVGSGGIRVGRRNNVEQAATIALGTQAETSLDVALGASDARMELGGIRLQRLKLEAGASRARVHFSESNPIRCSRADLTAGAGELAVIGLGYAQCGEVSLNGGVGKVTLDFAGRWTGRLHVSAEMAMGELVLRLPRGTGVRLALDRFLTSFAPAGLEKSADGKVWSSPGYKPDGNRLDLDVATAVGGVTVEWID